MSVLLSRLPYNKELPMMAQGAIDTSRAVQAGYAVVLQDCRGRFASEGEFTPIFNETNDGADTVDWIAQQPWFEWPGWHRGGILPRLHPMAAGQRAARGFAGHGHLPSPPPTITNRHGVILEVSSSWVSRCFGHLFMVPEELQRQLRQGKASMEQMGTLMQVMSNASSQFEHLPLVDMPLLRDFAPSYFDWLAHPTYDDYWRSIAHKEHYEQITVPALNIGGWYDIFLGRAWRTALV